MNKQIISQEQYTKLVSKICRDISTSEWRPDYVVGITRGGLPPAVMISHYFDVPMHALGVSLRDGGDCEHNCWMPEDAFGYHRVDGQPGTSNPALRKNILIVDDINDSGATLNWIMQDWESSCLPGDTAWEDIWNSNIRFAVVVDNLASQCSVGVFYAGMEINKAEEDVWIEFPYEEWWTK
jgi:hypoxanthine phosphoribosyltransferase